MKFKDRLIIFGFGAMLGAILVYYIKSQRAQDRPPEPTAPLTEVDVQRAAAPGILEAYSERRVPMQSDFIIASRLYPHPDEETYIRVLILQGQEPDQTLRIEETVVKEPDGERVPSVRVMSANRLVVTLSANAESAPLAQAIKPWGYRIIERGEGPDQYLLTLGSKEPEAVSDAIERVGAVPNVVRAEPLLFGR